LDPGPRVRVGAPRLAGGFFCQDQRALGDGCGAVPGPDGWLDGREPGRLEKLTERPLREGTADSGGPTGLERFGAGGQVGGLV
jgi:hypothetical protein